MSAGGSLTAQSYDVQLLHADWCPSVHLPSNTMACPADQNYVLSDSNPQIRECCEVKRKEKQSVGPGLGPTDRILGQMP